MTRTRGLLWLMLILPGLVWAENAESEAPWYQFEVLVFQRISAGAGSTEQWPVDPGVPSQENAVYLSRGEAVVNNKAIPFKHLPAEEQELADTWQTLRRSRDYRPLYLLAWRQPVSAPEQAEAVYFSLSSDDGSDLPKLEGRVRFGIKRYLHMDADILLRLPAVTEPARQDDLGYSPEHRLYRLQDSRRMRSGQTNYLDHPVLGVITLASRYEPPVIEPLPTPPQQNSAQPTAPQAVEPAPVPPAN
ncbi:MAG: CsiV family protein [Candidatus Thiodiazotropha sp.]